MIYDLLIQESTIENADQKSYRSIPPPTGGRFDRLAAYMISLRPPLPPFIIKTNKISVASLKNPSNLLLVNHQTGKELSARIFSTFQHIQLTGDFILGPQPATAILDLLKKQTCITTYTRKITVSLKHSTFVPVDSDIGYNPSALDDHPWLYPRPRITELNVRSPDEHNAMPDLAKLFEIFPQLEKIDIETETQSLLSLFPAAAASTEGLSKRGIEVHILPCLWHPEDVRNTVTENGIEKGSVRFEGPFKGEINLDFERDVRTGMVRDRVIRWRLFDSVLKSDEEVMRDRRNILWYDRWVARLPQERLAPDRALSGFFV